MKKIAIILFCVLLISFMFPSTVQADMGPKPSVVIDFNNLDGKVYYATLLSSGESLYTWYLIKHSQREISPTSPCIYALTANGVSFTLGFGLAILFPGIF